MKYLEKSCTVWFSTYMTYLITQSMFVKTLMKLKYSMIYSVTDGAVVGAKCRNIFLSALSDTCIISRYVNLSWPWNHNCHTNVVTSRDAQEMLKLFIFPCLPCSHYSRTNSNFCLPSSRTQQSHELVFPFISHQDDSIKQFILIFSREITDHHVLIWP